MTDRLSSSPLRLLGTRDGLTKLAAIDTTILKNGSMVFVTALEDYFYLLTESTAVADGITVVAPVNGPGRWFRAFIGGGQNFATQAEWYVDPVAGNDGNNGETAATALATMGELQNRLSGAYINQVTTVHILNDVPEADAFAPVLRIGPAGQMSFIGENPTVLATRTLTGVTAEVPATNTRGSITDAAFDWTPVLGNRARVTAGGNVGAVGWLQAIGGSADTAFVNRPSLGFVTSSFTNGDTVVVEVLTEIGAISLAGVEVHRSTVPPVLFTDLRFNRTDLVDISVFDLECEFLNCDVNIFQVQYRDAVNFAGCKLQGDEIRAVAEVGIYGCDVEMNDGFPFVNIDLVLSSNTSFVGRHGFSGCQVTHLTDIGFWEWLSDAAAVFIDGTVVIPTGRLWGTSSIADTYGIRVDGAECRYVAGSPPLVAGVLTATKDVDIGETDGTYAGVLPYVNPINLSRIVERY